MRPFVFVAITCLALLVGCDDSVEIKDDAPLEGVVVAVDSPSFGEVNSFTLKSGDETYEVFISDDVDYGFDLGHLQVHVQTADPVRVEAEERDGKIYALSIEDA